MEGCELTTFEASCPSVLGQPPFDPRLMVALLLTAYASGIYSSRRMRGVEKVRAQWALVCTAHNLTKLFKGA